MDKIYAELEQLYSDMKKKIRLKCQLIINEN